MSQTLRELLAELKKGTLSRADLYRLSNIDKDQAQEVKKAWDDIPVETRRKVVNQLVEIAENDFRVYFGQTFRVALGDPDPNVRQAAVEGLWEEEDVRLIPRLVTLFQEDKSPDVRAAAAEMLGRFMLLGELEKIRKQPYQEAYQALLAGCTSSTECAEVRLRALESLAYSGEEEVADLIDNAYRNPDESSRISAVFAMGRSADERWATFVIEELLNPNPAMRYEAARACGKLALEEAVPPLIEHVDDVDIQVQEAAIWALGQIGGEDARRMLESCLEAYDEAQREAAREALRELEFFHGDLSNVLFPFDFYDEEEEDLQ
jgi:HEAT repeat protein